MRYENSRTHHNHKWLYSLFKYTYNWNILFINLKCCRSNTSGHSSWKNMYNSKWYMIPTMKSFLHIQGSNKIGYSFLDICNAPKPLPLKGLRFEAIERHTKGYTFPFMIVNIITHVMIFVINHYIKFSYSKHCLNINAVFTNKS